MCIVTELWVADVYVQVGGERAGRERALKQWHGHYRDPAQREMGIGISVEQFILVQISPLSFRNN